MASIFTHKDGYRAQVRRVGHETQSKVFERKVDAQKWAREIEAAIDKGNLVAPGHRVTFSALAEAYEKNVECKGSKASALKLLKAGFGKCRLPEMTPDRIIKFSKGRDVSPVSRNGDLVYLNMVIQHGGVFAQVPAGALVAPQVSIKTAMISLKHMGLIQSKSNERDRRPTHDELETMFEHWRGSNHLELPMQEICLFLIATAMRRAEMCRIRFTDLEEFDRMLTIRDRKHPTKKKGNHQKVPLVTGHFKWQGREIDPLKIIKNRREYANSDTDRIFPFLPASITSNFVRTTKLCDIDDLRLHDLRHEGVSLLFEHGYQIQEVALVSGHLDWKQLKRYTQLKPASLHKRTFG